MGSVSKEEEDTERSNEQSVALMTLNSATQETSVSAKHIDTHLANDNGDKVSTSDVRSKFFSSIEDTVSTTSDSSLTTNDFIEIENSCPQDKTTGNVSGEFVILHYLQVTENITMFLFHL